MKQRIFLVIGLVLMVVLVVAMGTFFSTKFSFLGQQTNAQVLTPVPTPVATPTEVPTPTDTPTSVPTTPTPTPSPTPLPLVNGSSAYLLDVTSGQVLLNDNSHLRVPMWSTTKIMTALLAIEKLQPDKIVTVQQEELKEVPVGMSIAQLHATDQMSVLHLLYGLLLPSGSDAAVVLAHTVSGDTASFVSLMNSRAAQLGLKDTHYKNPYGADEAGHYSSAADLVKLARVAMGYPLFAQIVSTQHYHLDPNLSHYKYDWDNVLTSFLQSYPGASGIKTGSNAAENDWCMVFSASRHGHLLIGAEMQAPSMGQVFTDAANILNKGFA
jgi:serine-type D-Ala-D-Ala carboxypeptidase (penicillin-binding protein 5/6)